MSANGKTLDKFAALEEVLFKNLDALVCDSSPLTIALSGGSDSLFLTVLANKWARLRERKIVAVTVDHSLRPESADEALSIHKLMEKLGIAHQIKVWKHETVPNHGLENLAREARYRLLLEACNENDSHFLLVGHNLNEQIETFLIRKEMKSEESGLAAMSVRRKISENVFLLRPCLSFSKTITQAYLKKEKIPWVEDPMNNEEAFTRVRIRKSLKNSSEKEILNFANRIILYGKKREEREKLAVNFLKDFCKISPYGFAKIDLKEFEKIPPPTNYEILKRVIKLIGGLRYTVSDSDCREIIISEFRKNVGRVIFKAKKDELFFIREFRNLPKANIIRGKNVWDNRFEIEITDETLAEKKYEIRPYGKYEKIEEENHLPSYVAATLPSLWIDKKLVHVYNEKDDCGFRCKFLHKFDFLDIFYCLEIDGVVL